MSEPTPTKDHRLPLRDQLRDGSGLEAALVSTFNLDFHLFEEVVLRYLRRTGVHFVVLLADARLLGPLLLDPDRAPSHAGRAYALHPIVCQGSFHPKCILMVGEKAARLIIGSHNTTLPGFGLNRELTNVIDIKGPSDAAGSAALIEAFDFHRAWASSLPPALTAALDDLERFVAPYRTSPSPDPDLIVLGSRPGGPDTPSLWARLRPSLPQSATRVATLGPFYDNDLAFVRELNRAFAPKRLVVGLEPARVRFPTARPALPPGVELRDISAFTPAEHGASYLHAKAILIESGAERWLITGSANPTSAAWLDTTTSRNAELVVARRLKANELKHLAFDQLWDAPRCSAKDLAGVTPPGTDSFADGGHRPLLGVRNGTQISIEHHGLLSPPSATAPLGIVVRDFDGTPLIHTALVDERLIILTFETSDLGLRATTFEVSTSTGERYPGFVTHPDELREAAVSRSQQRYRNLIDGLNGETGGLQEWLKSVDRLIEAVAASAQSSPRPDPTASARTSSTVSSPKTARASKTLVHEDFNAALDYLMRHLWRQLPHLSAPLFAARAPDIANEEDEPPPEITDQQVIDGRVADKVAQKSRLLLKRLEKRIKGDLKDPVMVLRETVAVLGMLQLIRRHQDSDKWRDHELIDEVALSNWHSACVPELLRKNGLIDLVLQVPQQERDVSLLLSHLLWSTWLIGLGPAELRDDLRDYPPNTDDPDHEVDCESLAITLLLAMRIVELRDHPAHLDRAHAIKLLAEVPFEGFEPAPWLDQLIRFGEVGLAPATAPTLSRRTRPGDLAWPTTGARAAVCVSRKEKGPVLFNFDKHSSDPNSDERSTYLWSRVTTLDLGRILDSP